MLRELAVQPMPITRPCLTHGCTAPFDLEPYMYALRIKKGLVLSLAEAEELLIQLSEFELGRFMLQNKGLNGYWTAYLIIHGLKKQNLHPLEHWMLHRAPAIKATRERFQIFQAHLQRYLKNSTVIASVPCGLMDDLLSLDRSGLACRFVGIDLDPQSLTLAQDNALHHHCYSVTFEKKDAWHLDIDDAYDVITSNGLNIYQNDDDQVIALYREFYKALKDHGVLITSFLTPPPALSSESSWKHYDVDDYLKQQVIFGDIIQARWQTFRTEKSIRRHLESAGFKVHNVIEDTCGMFPTIIAIKAAQ